MAAEQEVAGAHVEAVNTIHDEAERMLLGLASLWKLPELSADECIARASAVREKLAQILDGERTSLQKAHAKLDKAIAETVKLALEVGEEPPVKSDKATISEQRASLKSEHERLLAVRVKQAEQLKELCKRVRKECKRLGVDEAEYAVDSDAIGAEGLRLANHQLQRLDTLMKERVDTILSVRGKIKQLSAKLGETLEFRLVQNGESPGSDGGVIVLEASAENINVVNDFATFKEASTNDVACFPRCLAHLQYIETVYVEELAKRKRSAKKRNKAKSRSKSRSKSKSSRSSRSGSRSRSRNRRPEHRARRRKRGKRTSQGHSLSPEKDKREAPASPPPPGIPHQQPHEMNPWQPEQPMMPQSWGPGGAWPAHGYAPVGHHHPAPWAMGPPPGCYGSLPAPPPHAGPHAAWPPPAHGDPFAHPAAHHPPHHGGFGGYPPGPPPPPLGLPPPGPPEGAPPPGPPPPGPPPPGHPPALPFGPPPGQHFPPKSSSPGPPPEQQQEFSWSGSGSGSGDNGPLPPAPGVGPPSGWLGPTVVS
eukprot:TRINITY_DN102496_c0_g1_i1.p1 TRINITY_DN102496_c0_g1~~TRINITY_DN102496_c0_g1_i1.p1  ORF type:complete len:536 (+),score=69.07 TRINITY_DN102496_c0_g1_i1:115-1722(+)